MSTTGVIGQSPSQSLVDANPEQFATANLQEHPSAAEGAAFSAPSDEDVQHVADAYNGLSLEPLGLPAGVNSSNSSEGPLKQADIKQPIRPSTSANKPASLPKLTEEQTKKLNGFIDGANPYAGAQPKVNTVKFEGIQFPEHSDKKTSPEDTVAGMPGLLPANTAQQTSHAGHADYTERRPEQTLMHFSSVMLYQAKKNGQKPIEVQYGYLKDGENLKLYSSANNAKAQKWLAENSGGDKLLQHVKEAASQNEDPGVKRHALKLLSFGENQDARKQQLEGKIDSGQMTPEHAQALKSDLETSQKLHQEFFTGEHNVVVNPAKKGRHAEQNIGVQMHQDAAATGGSNLLAEIAGSKIRCGSCNSELGPSVQDSAENFYVSGQIYPGQASNSNIKKMLGSSDERGRSAFRVSEKTGGRSESTSPARANDISVFDNIDVVKAPKPSAKPSVVTPSKS